MKYCLLIKKVLRFITYIFAPFVHPNSLDLFDTIDIKDIKEDKY